MEIDFYRGKRVFLTGHTGFKGMWLALLLLRAGAEVTGFALDAPTQGGRKALGRLGVLKEMRNVMGTVNLLECVRTSSTAHAVLVVTTDKVYENREWVWGYRENEPLMGYDPYAASKSCAELAVYSYRQSFFADGGVRLSSARAGNVIGGGDFAPDRVIPDCIRAAVRGQVIHIRSPHSTRPYQHVLEPLSAYLMLAARQTEDASLVGAWNVGPDDADCVTTGELADIFCRAWGGGARWQAVESDGPHEAHFLKLDCSKLRSTLGWRPRWHIEEAVEKTTEWAKSWEAGADMRAFTEKQIDMFLS